MLAQPVGGRVLFAGEATSRRLGYADGAMSEWDQRGQAPAAEAVRRAFGGIGGGYSQNAM